MRNQNTKEIVTLLLKRHGVTFAEESGIDVRDNSPSSLFSLLCLAVLCSARISHRTALQAAKALRAKRWTTAKSMAASTWKQRAQTLNRAGYARFDERTATMLGETAEMALELYGGDLRKLRAKAGRSQEKERGLLKEFKGIGETGADIFLREVQVIWPEVFPFADQKALDGAKALGLPHDAAALGKLVRGKRRYAQLISALVWARLEHTAAEIRRHAA